MVSLSREAIHVNMSGHMQHIGLKDTVTVYVNKMTQMTTQIFLTLLEETIIVKQPLQQALNLTELDGSTPCGTVLAVHVAMKDAAVLLLAGSTRLCPPAPQTTLR